MAKHYPVPVTPTLIELNAQALAGDADALRLLIGRSPQFKTFRELLEEYVPGAEVARVFDAWCDCWDRVQAKALLDTVELPAVESNLNAGWSG